MSSEYPCFHSFLRLPWLGGGRGPRAPHFKLSVSERYDVQKFSKTGNGKEPVVAGGGEDAVAREEFRAEGGTGLGDRRRPAADGAGGLWNFLYSHSADL